MGLKMFIWQW